VNSHLAGRPKQCPDAVVIVVVSMRLSGMSLSKIAMAMSIAGYKTPSGRDSWNRHIVFDLLHTRHVQEYMKRGLNF
jgi:hypothetical protein